MDELQVTPLNSWHKNAGANMADFGGFEMPLWYESGVKNEHLAVLKSAGIFDTSHMACIKVNGKDSFTLIQLCFTRNIKTLQQGRCGYGAFLDSNAHCIDDAIVYKFGDTNFVICVNAGMGARIAGHLSDNKGNFQVEIEDLTEKIAKMDVQGKNSARILSRVVKDPEKVFEKMPYFSFKGNFEGSSDVELLDGTPVLLSRSGYTGEFGFEIFVTPDAIVKLWQDILEAGKEYHIMACGLASRDSLRVGACLPLSHQDIGNWEFINHPWEFALPYNNDASSFTKDFLGRQALENSKNESYTYPFAGKTLRKVAAGENTFVIDEEKNNIGWVLTCATDMGISRYENKIVSLATPGLPEDVKIKGIGCGFVRVSKQLEPGTKLELKEGNRSIKVSIVSDIRPDRTARKKITNFI
jgi:aminomethyltransferase